ncbi:ribosome hibernation factor-recruiting GTPase MRF [Mycolicibacterium pallens]|uniref:GTP-binding protein n=1 Tax=Mycolicibacterium pallens TaxID=370524 RepID=A0ABX8VJQ7_9MYCO|nr:GTP-binding protein [Mycolicibacterium pallens]QYL18039.1 GTP-binding protein [Mycolicibacterium pallens]
MRTPVLLVTGQGDTNAVARILLRQERTLVVRHDFDGHVVHRMLTNVCNGVPTHADYVLELEHGCISCTVRNDLLLLLRRLHRRADVDRIVVHLAPTSEPEPICWAINHVRTRLGPGYLDGPAARDVEIVGVITCLDPSTWLCDALSDDELDDGRTAAQVAVGQTEFSDVVVAPRVDRTTVAALRRLAPRAWIVQLPEHVEEALGNLDSGARRGRSDDPHAPLLAGEPPLEFDGQVGIVEFEADRPFHPERLHDALDVLLTGVLRSRGRIWLANQSDTVMYLESAGGGLRVSSAGKWLAAMSDSEIAYVEPERRVLASLVWDDRYGDRRTSMTALVCGAAPAAIEEALRDALLTDDEMSGPEGWPDYPDPFGDWHEEPCGDAVPTGEIPTPTTFYGEDR